MIRAAFGLHDVTRRARGVLATTLTLGALAIPGRLVAQDSTAAAAPADATANTHTVKQGDTLWDIARQYLGDPFLWPEIYRINTDVVEDPHWIYPGETLRLPGGQVAAAAPTQDTTQVQVAQAQPDTEEPLATAPTSGETIFGRQMQARRAGESHRGALIGRTAAVPITMGEFYAAPYLDRVGGPEGAGRILRSAEVPGIAEASGARRIQINETVYLTPPAGGTPAVGTRYMVYRLGPLVGDGQVIIPTGFVTVTKTDDGSTLARLTTSYDNVELDQRLIPVVSFQESRTHALPFDGELGSKLIWVQGDPELPSIQHYVVLDVTDRQGLHTGDEFGLIRPATTSNGSPITEHRIATARVVRVTPFGTTALIVAQTDPAVEVGMPAKLVAKMP